MKKRSAVLILITILCVIMCLSLLTACNLTWPSMDEITGGTENNTPSPNPDGNLSGGNTKYEVNVNTVTAKPSGENSLADVIERIHSQVVEIYVTLPNGSSAGSGTFIGKAEGANDYFILTAMHVVDGASDIQVRTTDGETYEADFMGGVPDNDIAVIKITSEKTQNIATIRNITDDASKLRIGEDAIAIGNPLGTLGGSVSKGIISAIARDMRVENYQMTLIQMDTSINGGNSGGALFDSNGNLIGVVNAKIVKEEVEGISFAIPINDALDIALSVIRTAGDPQYNGLGYHEGKILLGITVQGATLRANGQFVLRVVAIDSYGSAYGSELKTNDYITEIEGKTVSDSNDLKTALSQKSIGDTLSLKVLRNNATVSVNITLRQYVYGFIRTL